MFSCGMQGIQRFTSSSLEAKPFEVVRVRYSSRCAFVALDLHIVLMFQVRNRFNPRFDSKHSAGYRDLAFKIKVGFEVCLFCVQEEDVSNQSSAAFAYRQLLASSRVSCFILA